MKTTLNTYDIIDALRKDDNANWSVNGARALAEYLEEYEESTGEELELDVCALRCDFAEYASLQEWASDYFSGDWRVELDVDADIDDDDELDEIIRNHINDNGQLIEFDGGIIVSSF